jgi:ergothioneine biosynthesis protein EgtB
VTAYRVHVDDAMATLFERGLDEDDHWLVELGLHHEQQHQELILMDIKHALFKNPLHPTYVPTSPPSPAEPRKAGWLEHDGGLTEIGHPGVGGFAFDNESPRHLIYLQPFRVTDRAVTCEEWLEFIADEGYSRPELWLSDGWTTVQQLGWRSPMYWFFDAEAPGSCGGWQSFTLAGPRSVDPSEPVCHVSYYEADAFARWSRARLPTEAEWEVTAAQSGTEGNWLDLSVLHPVRTGDSESGFLGNVWEWTSSPYSPYPGFRVAPGAVGEYNGKFMVNQYVLRGGCCATPEGHVRPTYRNFFPASARWAFSGLRLARDL